MSSIDFGESVKSSFCVRNQVLLLSTHGEERLYKHKQTHWILNHKTVSVYSKTEESNTINELNYNVQMKKKISPKYSVIDNSV